MAPAASQRNAGRPYSLTCAERSQLIPEGAAKAALQVVSCFVYPGHIALRPGTLLHSRKRLAAIASAFAELVLLTTAELPVPAKKPRQSRS